MFGATIVQVQLLEHAGEVGRRASLLGGSVPRRRFVAVALALMAYIGVADAGASEATIEPMTRDVTLCEAAAVRNSRPSPTCLMVVGHLTGEAHRYCQAGDASAAQPYLDHAKLIAPQDLRITFEQALVDAASGHPSEARKRFDLLQGTALERAAAVPSAVNLAALGRFDDARKAFMALAGSADTLEASNAQLWQLWLDARTWRGDLATLREKLARDTVGLRAGNAQQQALLNLYAGQGSVDEVFATIDASMPDNSERRRDARIEAAFFAGGYLQYVVDDTAAAQRLYWREITQSGASVERSLIQESIKPF